MSFYEVISVPSVTFHRQFEGPDSFFVCLFVCVFAFFALVVFVVDDDDDDDHYYYCDIMVMIMIINNIMIINRISISITSYT